MNVRHKHRRGAKEADPAAREDLFNVVPLIPGDVEGRRDSKACLQLKRELDPPGRVARFFARRLHFKKLVRVNLDERGTFFWEQIDGSRSLRDIERVVRRTWELDETESRRSTVLFVKGLMSRHLLYLKKTPTPGEPPGNGGQD